MEIGPDPQKLPVCKLVSIYLDESFEQHLLRKLNKGRFWDPQVKCTWPADVALQCMKLQGYV